MHLTLKKYLKLNLALKFIKLIYIYIISLKYSTAANSYQNVELVFGYLN